MWCLWLPTTLQMEPAMHTDSENTLLISRSFLLSHSLYGSSASAFLQHLALLMAELQSSVLCLAIEARLVCPSSGRTRKSWTKYEEVSNNTQRSIPQLPHHFRQYNKPCRPSHMQIYMQTIATIVCQVKMVQCYNIEKNLTASGPCMV